MQHSRSYSYHDQTASDPSRSYPTHSQSSTRSSYEHHEYYGNGTASSNSNHAQYYYRPSNDLSQTRYSSDGGPHQYQPSGLVPSSLGMASTNGYSSPPSPYASHPYSDRSVPYSTVPSPVYSYTTASQPPRAASSSAHSQFIPTPSQMADPYPATHRLPPLSPSHRRSSGPYSSQPHPAVPSSSARHSESGLVRGSNRPRASTRSSTGFLEDTVPPSAERYPCDRCPKTFSRAHDRKRHFETQHTLAPTVWKCPYCEKDFSRSDSLKRHTQNGCDEAPQE